MKSQNFVKFQAASQIYVGAIVGAGDAPTHPYKCISTVGDAPIRPYKTFFNLKIYLIQKIAKHITK